MRKAKVYQQNVLAGILAEEEDGFSFQYVESYAGEPVSLTMPMTGEVYKFHHFPAVFEGLLPEGAQLEAILRRYKLDRNDHLSQLLQVGGDLVGSLTVKGIS